MHVSGQTEFQFQYGTIKGIIYDKWKNEYVGFNSNMVRLRVNSSCSFRKNISVSIPIWYD